MNIYRSVMVESQSVFVHTILCILAIIFSVPVVSLAFPVWLVFVLFQSIAATWIFFWKIGYILATRDVPFALESNPRNFITSLFTVKGNLSVRVLREAFCTRILQGTHESHLRLKQCVHRKMGRYVRSDEENFDIKRHIFVYKGPPPTTDEQLARCYGEIISQTMPSNMSPWQIILIPRGSRSGTKSFAVCVRVHHSIGDGFALVGLFVKMVDNKPVFVKPNIKQNKKSILHLVLRTLFTGPLAVLCILFTKVENPFRQNKSQGEIKVAWTKPIELADIKRSKNKFGTTINDVLSACVAGAFRRYLISSGVEAPNDLQIVITVNTRNLSSLLDGEIPLENNSTGVFFNLPVGTATLPDRVLETKRRMDMIKGSTMTLLFGFFFNYVMATLPECIVKYSNHTVNKCCCMVMSNVPGPLNQLELEGNVIESAMVFPPLISDTGISVAIFSYAGKIRVSVKTDSAVISDPTVLIDNFTKEVEDLLSISQ